MARLAAGHERRQCRLRLEYVLETRPADEAADALVCMLVEPHRALTAKQRQYTVFTLFGKMGRGRFLGREKQRVLFRALAAHPLLARIDQKRIFRLLCHAGTYALFAFATAPPAPFSRYTWKIPDQVSLPEIIVPWSPLTYDQVYTLLSCIAHLIPESRMTSICTDILRASTRFDGPQLHATAARHDEGTLVDLLRAIPGMADRFLRDYDKWFGFLDIFRPRVDRSHACRLSDRVGTVIPLEIVLALASNNARACFFNHARVRVDIEHLHPAMRGHILQRLSVWRPLRGVASLQWQCALDIHRRIILGDYVLAAECTLLENSIPAVNILRMCASNL